MFCGGKEKKRKDVDRSWERGGGEGIPSFKQSSLLMRVKMGVVVGGSMLNIRERRGGRSREKFRVWRGSWVVRGDGGKKRRGGRQN